MKSVPWHADKKAINNFEYWCGFSKITMLTAYVCANKTQWGLLLIVEMDCTGC